MIDRRRSPARLAIALVAALGCSEPTPAASTAPGDATTGEAAPVRLEVASDGGSETPIDASPPADASASSDSGDRSDLDSAGADADADAEPADDPEVGDVSDPPPDGLADGDADTVADAVADDGGAPSWLGVCPPEAKPTFGPPAATVGYPVPGRHCAKPGWPSAPGVPPTWTDITVKIGLGTLGVTDSCLLWEDVTGDLAPDLVVIEQPLTPMSKRHLKIVESTPSGAWNVTNLALPAATPVLDCARVDWNDDGVPELALVGFAGVWLIESNGGPWVNATASKVPAIAKQLSTFTLSVADVDRDGDQDVYLGRTGPMDLQPGSYSCLPVDYPYVQCCHGVKGPTAACLEQLKATPAQWFSCCPPSQLGATNVLLRNDKTAMVDVSIGCGAADPGATLVTAVRDIDRDGWPDFFVGNDFGPLSWYKNHGNLTFSQGSTGWGLRPYGHIMGIATGDFDGDGDDDLVTADMGPSTLYRGKPGGGWQSDGGQSGLVPVTQDAVGWSQLAADFDNDGWLDLFSAHSMKAKPGKLLPAIQTIQPGPYLEAGQNWLLQGNGKTFKPIGVPWVKTDEQLITPVASAASDFDGDGDLDLAFLSSPGNLRVLRNDGPKQHWIAFELAAVDSPTGGVGAIVQVWAQGYAQERYISWTPASNAHGDYPRHFGLGGIATVDQIVVWWPSGKVSLLGPTPADQVVTVHEADAKAPAPPASDAGGGDSAADASADAAPPAPGSPALSGIEPLQLQLQPQVGFTEITASLPLPHKDGLIRRDCVLGADLDGDDDDDLVTIEQENLGPGKTVYRIRALLREGGGFATKVSPIDATKTIPALGCFGVDVNGDARIDLAIGTVGQGVALFENDGAGQFSDKTDVYLPAQDYDAWGGAFGDFDHDGDIEILVGAGDSNAGCTNVACGYIPGDYLCVFQQLPPAKASMQDRLFKRPNSMSKFADITQAAKLPAGGELTEVMVIDIDRDGWVDALVGNDFGDHFLLHNDKGKFVRYDKDIGFAGYANHMGWGVGDFNQDGIEDLVVADAGPSLLYLGQKPKPGLPVSYQSAGKAWGLAAASHDTSAWNPLVFDYDHDGWEDIWLPTAAIMPYGGLIGLIACGLPSGPAPIQRDLVFRNTGMGKFEVLVGPAPSNQQYQYPATPATVLDLDGDGDLDIAEVRKGGSIHVLRNDVAPPKSAVLVRLATKGKNSLHAGAWFEASWGGKTHLRHMLGNTGYGGAAFWRAHFGVGVGGKIDQLKVHWPSGAVSTHGALAAGTSHVLSEP